MQYIKYIVLVYYGECILLHFCYYIVANNTVTIVNKIDSGNENDWNLR